MECEQSLDTYEQKLNRFEAVENALHAANGVDGVTIRGGNNSTIIAQLRSALEQARSAKHSSGARAASTDKLAISIRRVAVLRVELDTALELIEKAGLPEKSWSKEQLEHYSRLIVGVEAIAEQELTG